MRGLGKIIWKGRTCAALALPLLASLLLLASPSFARGNDDAAERTLFESVNRERAAQRLRPLRWDARLANSAKQHAERMARQNTLSHQLPGEEDFKARAVRAGARFSVLAENVAEGQSALGIHTQWMNSQHHRENILDPELDSIGIGVSERNGQMFAVEDFSRAVADLSLEEQEHELGATVKAHGLKLLNGGADSKNSYVTEARWSCALDTGYAGSHRPQFILRYSTADLDNLPTSLTQRMRSGKYHSAVVGACQPTESSDFSNYRVIVLLYE